MDYAEAREAFFSPGSGTAPALDWTTPARRLRDAAEPVATICFWSEPVYDAYAACGLDFLTGYVWGRASALGEPDPSVVAAAFGVFEPGLVADLYTAGRTACSLEQVRAAKVAGSATALRQVLGAPEDDPDLSRVLDALRPALEAQPTLGRPFFAGLRGQDWPSDGWAALWHACTLLREHRGDAHLAVLVAAGLDGVQANVLTERWVGWEPLAYTGSRAWAPEAMAAATAALTGRGLLEGAGLSDAGRELREQLEASTDAAEQGLLDAIGSDLDTVVSALSRWAEQVVAGGWFPPDPLKRASG